MTNNIKNHRPFWLYLLWILILLQSLTAIYGGGSLMLDPSGNLIHMPLFLLKSTPFHSYFIPGAVLFLLLGVFPLCLLYPLITRPHWRWANVLNIYPDKYWAWTYSLYVGIMLIIWIESQLMLIGYFFFLQTMISSIGIAITILTLTPAVQQHFTMDIQTK